MSCYRADSCVLGRAEHCAGLLSPLLSSPCRECDAVQSYLLRYGVRPFSHVLRSDSPIMDIACIALLCGSVCTLFLWECTVVHMIA